jgi:hypothetical protein
MKPVIRPEGADPHAPPDGWVVEPIGAWGDGPCEVAYDPRRYDVLAALGPKASADLQPILAGDGWEPYLQHGSNVLWIRDRVVAARAALAQEPTTRNLSVDLPGL